MLIDTTRYQLTNRCPQSAPDTEREALLNQLCELREDPRFTEWCRLTSALGLGSLTLGQLAALHADTAETIFPEIVAWGQTAVGDFGGHPFETQIPFGLDDHDGATDAVLGDIAATTWPADGASAPGNHSIDPVVLLDGGAFDGRFGDASAHDGRAK